MEMLMRFLIGGTLVSLFAAFGDVARPKSFAGIFGAAPSIALATVALTIGSEGVGYAAIEARSMIAGAVALLGYTWLSSRLLWSTEASAPAVTLAGLVGWLALALSGGYVLLRAFA
jgi:hypothetical protein